jgi:hypothetical protein
MSKASEEGCMLLSKAEWKQGTTVDLRSGNERQRAVVLARGRTEHCQPAAGKFGASRTTDSRDILINHSLSG